jgi:hypothetical protein
MALKKSFARRPSLQPRRDHVPPLPHPSWRLNAAGPDFSGAVRIVQAKDFWDKLGI